MTDIKQLKFTEYDVVNNGLNSVNFGVQMYNTKNTVFLGGKTCLINITGKICASNCCGLQV